MANEHEGVKIRRPWTMATAGLTAAHHGFELSSGVGLVLQPELGLRFAGALWGTAIPAWIRLAAKGDQTRWDPLLAAWSGASLAGVVVHFSLWPWRHNRLGIPVLTEAEGLSSSSLPAYDALLYAWAAACHAFDLPRDSSWGPPLGVGRAGHFALVAAICPAPFLMAETGGPHQSRMVEPGRKLSRIWRRPCSRRRGTHNRNSLL